MSASKASVTVLAIIFAVVLAGCSSADYQTVSLGALAMSPAEYTNEAIGTTGWIATQTEERTYYLAYPYWNPVLETMQVSISEVEVRAWLLQDDYGNQIAIADRSGGLCIPMMPYVPSFAEQMVSPVRVWGKWTETKTGYVLMLHDFEGTDG